MMDFSADRLKRPRRAALCGSAAICLAWLAPLPALADSGDSSAAQKYEAEATQMAAKGDFRSAEIDFKNAVKADPANGDLRLKLAEVEIRLNDIDGAQVELKAARQYGAPEAKLITLLSRIYLLQGKFDQMLQDFPIQDSGPIDVRVATLIARAEAQIQLKNLDDAKSLLTTASQLQPDSTAPKLALARIAFTQGQLDEALSRTDELLRAAPSPDIQMLKGEILNRKGDHAGAMAEFEAGIKADPGNIAGYIERAQLYIGTGAFDKAQADVNTALGITPGSIPAQYLQALLLTQKKDYAGADTILTKCAAAFPNFPRGYYLQAIVKSALNQYEQAQNAIAAYLTTDPNDPAGEKIQADILLKKGDPAQAADTLEKVASETPNDAQALAMLGEAYTKLHRPQQAVDAFERATKLAPGDAALMRGLALNLLATGQGAKGESELQDALRVDPDDDASAEALALIYIRQKDFPKAQKLVDDLRARRPNDPIPGSLAGMVELAQSHVAPAEAAYVAVVAKFPDFTPARLQLAYVYSLEGKTDQSKTIYEDILKKDSGNLAALQSLSAILVARKDMDGMVALWEKSHRDQPDNVPIALGLIQALIAQKNIDAGLATVRDMQIRQPNEPRLYAMRAELELQKNDAKAAIVSLERLTELQPQDPAARRDLALARQKVGDLPGAIAAMAEARKLDPASIPLAAEEIELLGKRNPDDGVAAAQRMAQLMPDQPSAQALEGDYLLLLKRPADSVAAYKRAFHAHPSLILAERLATSAIRDGKPEEGEKILSDWSSAHPEDIGAKFALANFALGQKNWAVAQSRYEALLKDHADDPLILNNLAFLYQRNGDARALDFAKRAHDGAPQNGAIDDTLGWIMVQGKNVPDGLKLIQQAHDSAPDDLDVAYHLAFALDQAGKKAEATDLLKKLIGAGHDFDTRKDAQSLLDRLSKT